LILKEVEFGSKPFRLAKARQRDGRKEKNHDKMKCRQGKTLTSPAEELPVVVAEDT
jgi:hypothetical protein